MVALGFALLMLAFAGWMAGSARRFHVAPIAWLGAWGTMLLLYRIFGRGYEYLQWVIWFTVACVAAWTIGHFVAAGLQIRGEPVRAHREYQLRRLRLALAACTLIGLAAPVAWAATVGLDITRITSGAALSDAAQTSYALLLEQRVEQDAVTKLSLMVALAGVIVAGLYIGLGRPIDRSVPPKPPAPGEVPKPLTPTPYWLLLAPFVPYVVMMLLTTLRTLLVVPLLMFLGAWVAGRYLIGRERGIFRAGSVGRLAAALVATIAVIILMQSLRGGGNLAQIDRTVGDMRVWVAGYEPGLVAWMSREWDRSLHWGASTFRVLAGAFGAEDAKLVYGAGQIDIGGGQSNAMTALRFFVEDWGMAGAVAFCLLFGLLTGWASEQVRRGQLAVAPVYALLLATVVFAPNSWFLNYGARLFAPALAVGYLLFFGSRAGERTEHGAARTTGSRGRRRSADSTGTKGVAASR